MGDYFNKYRYFVAIFTDLFDILCYLCPIGDVIPTYFAVNCSLHTSCLFTPIFQALLLLSFYMLIALSQ